MAINVCIKKLYKSFGLDISFETESKRIGILGASGCGKSLTLKAIAGLVRPDEGSITFDDKILFDSASHKDIKPGKRDVGYLFQDFALFPNMTVEKNIEVAVRDKTNKSEIRDSLLKKYNIWDVRDRLPAKLSGGEKQRTALARMMASSPGLLLLDEPFSAMDAYLRDGLRMELTKTLRDYDKTFILVSHDRDEVYQMCDYILLMDGGKVIRRGNTDDVFRNPGTVSAARLTGCKNISRIEKLGPQRVRALDWNGIELSTADEITEDTEYIGIRAHDFTIEGNEINRIICGQVSIFRAPFEWNIRLENGLLWKLGKNMTDDDIMENMPDSLSISPDKIILLKRG